MHCLLPGSTFFCEFQNACLREGGGGRTLADPGFRDGGSNLQRGARFVNNTLSFIFSQIFLKFLHENEIILS